MPKQITHSAHEGAMAPADSLKTLWRFVPGTYGRWRGKRLDLDNDPIGTALRDLGRGDFEALVAETFRHRGFRVGAPLSGHDARLRALPLSDADGQALAHIRHWRAWAVDAAEVQILITDMAATGIRRGYLVIPGEFTRAARRLAEGHPLELIDGDALSDLIQAEGTRTLSPSVAPAHKPNRPIRIPWRWPLRIAGVLLAGFAILLGFRWIESLPDKRLAAQAPPPAPLAIPAPAGPIVRVPEPPAPQAAPTPPPPSPGPGGFRSVAELDAAFDAFYLPPPGCASPSSRDLLVECANDRIRARKTFMAAGEPAGPEPDDSSIAPTEEPPRNDSLVWDNSEEAIDALAPISNDEDRPGYPPPFETQSAFQGPDDDAPGEPPGPVAIPVPSERPRDPEATYIPYDPKSPWVAP